MNFMVRIRNAFLTGLIVLLPLLVSVWVFFAFAQELDGFFQPVIRPLLRREVPGLGFILGILVILFFGFITPYYIGRKLQSSLDRMMMRIPFLRGIYRTTRQVIDVARASGSTSFKKAVLVEYPRRDLYMLGFITAEAGLDISASVNVNNNEKLIFVFIPTTPNPTSGFLVAVPEKDLIPLDMKPDDALRLVVSAGLLQPGISSLPRQTSSDTETKKSAN